MLVKGTHYRTVWMEEGTVLMIDLPLLPHKLGIYRCSDHRQTALAIKTMVIRGAGAIGAAAGYAMAQAVIEAAEHAASGGFGNYIETALETIRKTRPTAQNLFYACGRVHESVRGISDPAEAAAAAVKEANAIADEDAASCREIGEKGESLIRDGYRVLTHCNAGWLAFVDWGSALSPVYAARRKGKRLFVWVDETRPRCQGARLTAWELKEEGIDFAVIADNASGYYMKKGEVDMVIVGSDRIALNGDVANKIGTYEKAVLARENGIPFYVAAPTSTIDWECPSGDDIPIEERDAEEVLSIMGRDDDDRVIRVTITPRGAEARNPAFDVTPARYITGIITEKGIVKPEELAGFSNSWA